MTTCPACRVTHDNPQGCPVCSLMRDVVGLVRVGEATRDLVAQLMAIVERNAAPLRARVEALEAAEVARRTPAPPECMACLRSDCPGPANCGPAFLAARRAEGG